MRTSVVICTRNRLDQLLKFTASLSEQMKPPSEYVIVDSSDTPLEESAVFGEAVEGLPFPVTYAHTEPDLTKQRNRGIEVATGEVLYFFDDDVVLHPDYLRQMNATYAEHPEYVGGMGTLANLPSGLRAKVRATFSRFFCIMHQFGDGKFYRSGFPRFPHGRLKSLSDTEVLSGFMMSFRKSVLDEFKFDATLSGHSYMEDVDMAYRVSRKHRLFFNPDAELEHRHVRRPVDNSRDRRRQFLYNHRYFYEKNFSQQPSWHRLWHWWSIIGMFIWCITKPPTWFIGYCQALVRFRKDRKQLLGELRAIGENRG